MRNFVNYNLLLVSFVPAFETFKFFSASVIVVRPLQMGFFYCSATAAT